MHLYVSAILYSISLVSCLAPGLVGAEKSTDITVTADLWGGKVKLLNNITLNGDQYYWDSKHDDRRGFAYYGYKYGTARRFQDSIPNTDFSYMKNSSHPKPGYSCPQLPFSIPGLEVFHRNLSMNEECLYLDVYVPPVHRNEGKTWPVLFWIHEGGFASR